MNWTGYLVPSDHRRINEFVGLLVLTLGILLALSLISFNPDDPSFNISQNKELAGRPTNFIGVVGSYSADVFFQTWGYAAFLLPIFLGVYAFYWLASWPVASFGIRVSGMVLMATTLSAGLALSPLPARDHFLPGGLLGRVLADGLQASFNGTGAAIVLISTFLVSLFLSTTFSFTGAVALLKPRLRFVSVLSDRWAEWQAERAQARANRDAEPRKEKTPKKQTIITEKTASRVEERRDERREEIREETRRAPVVAPPVEQPKPIPVAKRKQAASTATSTEFPATTLLRAPKAAVSLDEDELRQRAKLIEEKTREFEVEGTVQQIHPGPVVTTFEFKPEPGVKYSRITALGDDLCLALEAESVRIDRIPGKSTVGMEVPNDERATIVLREMVESSEYQHSNYRLPLALGKDIRGKIVISDLQKMPHLLAAGSTGTGKSVSINTMILSLLYRSRPDQVKMILIDPKRLELGLYQDIPHLLVPVVTEPKIAQNALKWAVMEMESRYKKLAKRGVRNLEAYNEQVKQLPIPGMEDAAGAEEDRDPLP
jgi:DNA segregation ATPase FtsK/SpoIIIE, S-DNA-T family